MQIDTSTPFGARVADRLANDQIGWLTTVGKDGTPHPKPVWFLPQGDDILIYSRPHTAKIAHIARNPRVSLNLDGDGHGGNIVILAGSARVDESLPPAHQLPEYVAKYENGMNRVTGSPEAFSAMYSVGIRFTPEKLSGH
jgi:PPOX class probable F420-dependent enzyme